MDFLRLRHVAMRFVVVFATVAFMVTGCGNQSADEPVAWHIDPTAPIEVPAASPNVIPDLPSAQPNEMLTPQFLNASELKSWAPNELSLVPVLEYHVITTDPAKEAQFVRPVEEMKADLDWLYDHGFYVITMRQLIENTISAPAGKHPVVLTFDDATSTHFSATRDASGSLIPDPDSAIGILEAFFTAHPDFGHTAFFSFVPNNCFAVPDEDQRPLCHEKLKWLADHGYEVGNHTYYHTHLFDVDDETFIREIGQTKLFIDRYVPQPANMGDVLTVPFGDYPDRETRREQRRMLREGFQYEGQTIRIRAALMVGANPAVSPASNVWDPIFIPRIQAFDDSLDYWFDAFEFASVPLYVSDGNANAITVPDLVPAYLQDHLDPPVISDWGRDLIQYDPDTGETTDRTTD